MASTKHIRQLLGISQQQLADYLNVTRAQLAMAETGRRQLPTAALLKLGAIERNLSGNPSARLVKEMQKQTIQAQKMLLLQAQQYNKLAAMAAKKLEAMRNRRQECLKALQATAGLLAELPAGAASKKDRLWLELVEAAALRKIADCGIGEQAILELQADVFSYHARKAKEMTL